MMQVGCSNMTYKVHLIVTRLLSIKEQKRIKLGFFFHQTDASFLLFFFSTHTMSNPFEEPSSNQNPWSSPSANSNGPLYGNAYESTNISSASPALPPRKPANNTASSPYGTQRMPSPSDYANNTPVVNAWQESNKTLDEQEFGRNSPQQPVNAYQYTGTAYGNTSTPATAYSPQPVHNNAANTTSKIETPMTVTDSPATVNRADLPSKIRLLLRVVLFISAVGHLGFAAGASPVSVCLRVIKRILMSLMI